MANECGMWAFMLAAIGRRVGSMRARMGGSARLFRADAVGNCSLEGAHAVPQDSCHGMRARLPPADSEGLFSC